MKNTEYSIVKCYTDNPNRQPGIEQVVVEFSRIFAPKENNLYLFEDARTGAIFCECHISAEKLVGSSTIDVPLDPDEQPEYRANRDVAEDSIAFEVMKTDAKAKRTFSNIVCEYQTSFDEEHPLKIIGGQHRIIAINEAFGAGINEYHGIKVYFGLDMDQRLDVQVISNVNISVSPDLYDRLQETATGSDLRDWCQRVGLLGKGKDFSAKREPENPVTVRLVRSFILNYYNGQKLSSMVFDDVDTTPMLCKTGKPDPDWEHFRKANKNIWKDASLEQAGKEFVALLNAQRNAVENMRLKGNKIPAAYADKALTFAVVTAWAYVAGVLQSNQARLQRHYDLKSMSKVDPLNASAMAAGRHKTDPENYRGLGTRNDSKEMGRCVELFFAQAENGKGITSSLIDLAIKKYHLKQDKLEVTEVEKKVKNG